MRVQLNYHLATILHAQTALLQELDCLQPDKWWGLAVNMLSRAISCQQTSRRSVSKLPAVGTAASL